MITVTASFSSLHEHSPASRFPSAPCATFRLGTRSTKKQGDRGYLNPTALSIASCPSSSGVSTSQSLISGIFQLPLPARWALQEAARWLCSVGTSRATCHQLNPAHSLLQAQHRAGVTQPSPEELNPGPEPSCKAPLSGVGPAPLPTYPPATVVQGCVGTARSWALPAGVALGPGRVSRDPHKPGMVLQRGTGDAPAPGKTRLGLGGDRRWAGTSWRDGAPWARLTLQTAGPTEGPSRAGDLHTPGCVFSPQTTVPQKPLNLRESPQQLCPVLLAAGADAHNGITLTGITRVEGPTYRLEPQEAAPAASPAATATVTKALIIRRGLAVVAAVAVLALGVIVKLLTGKH